MNIQSLLEKIALFKAVVEESGFKRDMEEYESALENAETQSNLASLKDIAEKVRDALQLINDSGLKEAMDIVRPEVKSFTDYDHLAEVQQLIEDPTIETDDFHTKLAAVLSPIVSEIETDSKDLKSREEMFRLYVPNTEGENTEGAILSVILKDLETISSLKKFARTLDRWNQALLLFHQLVKSDSPKESV